jgi:hypothetical protein
LKFSSFFEVLALFGLGDFEPLNQIAEPMRARKIEPFWAF